MTGGAARAADGPAAIVIGGGFAGIAAATALAAAGRRVTLLEARPHLGGRARSWTDPETGAVVDNGQHLLMGCCRDTLALLDRLGSRDGLDLQPRLAVPFAGPDGSLTALRAARAPYPWDVALGLLRFPGLGWGARLRLLRVGLAARRRRPAAALQALDETSVASWLRALGQSPEAARRLWDPLALAVLNEEPERASAAMFVAFLREMLASGPAGPRLGVPRTGLSALYVDPALRYLRAHGATVRLRAQVRSLLFEAERCTGVLLADGARLPSPAIVAAVPHPELLEILPPRIAAEPIFRAAALLETSPIVSIYLWFGGPVTSLPFAALEGGRWHWLFNRAAHGAAGGDHGVTLVRSAARAFVEAPRDTLVRSALEDVRACFPGARRATLRHALVIKERKAALSPATGTARLRPPSATSYPGLHLAGDWIATGLPATIESAVRSGHACAAAILAGERADRAGPAPQAGPP